MLLYPDIYLNEFHFGFLYINAINPIHFAHPASPHPHPSVLTREQQIEFALCENLCLQKSFIRKQFFSAISFESAKRFPRAGFILRCIFIQEVSLFPILAHQDRAQPLPPFRALCSALLSNSASAGSVFCTHQNLLYWCSAHASCKLCFCYCPWVRSDRGNWVLLENVLVQILQVASFQKKTKWSCLWGRSPMVWWVDCW